MTTKGNRRIKLDRSPPSGPERTETKTVPDRPAPVPEKPKSRRKSPVLPKSPKKLPVVPPPETSQEPSGEPQGLPATHVAGDSRRIALSGSCGLSAVSLVGSRVSPGTLASLHRLQVPFVRLVWDHLKLPAPTPVQLDIAEYIQHGPRRCRHRGLPGHREVLVVLCVRLLVSSAGTLS